MVQRHQHGGNHANTGVGVRDACASTKNVTAPLRERSLGEGVDGVEGVRSET